MTMSKTSKKAVMLAMRDRLMEEFKELEPEIKRVIEDGPQDDADITLIKKCMLFTLGEIDRHRVEWEESENEEDCT